MEKLNFKKKDKIYEKVKACILLHALGDTIGFNNGKWEFKVANTVHNLIYEKIYEYIDYGGINKIPKNNWNVSDDTLMHIAVLKSLNFNFKNVDNFCDNLSNQFIDVFNQYFKNNINKRAPGLTSLKNIQLLIDGYTWKDMEYDFFAGGCGASMRTSCIGLAFYGSKNRNKLIDFSIKSSIITHYSTIGYLGGLVSALFTSFAIENVDIKLWPFMLMELFENKTIEKYIQKNNLSYDKFKRDSTIFINKWYTYINDKFDSNNNVIKRKSSINLVERTKYYFNQFAFEADKRKNQVNPGSGGDDSVIIAYDSLLDSEDNWEKLVFYSMLHGGDTDSTGCIAASWYGAYYGFGCVPQSRINLVEFKDEIDNLVNKFYNKFY